MRARRANAVYLPDVSFPAGLQVTSDLDRASEVEITFTEVSERRTRVTLVHRHIERHGQGWELLRDGLEAEDGWPLYLGRYADLTCDRGEGP